MVDYIADGIGTAGGTAFARVDALVASADQVIPALAVRTTADLAPILTTDFVVLAFVVVSAKESAKAGETLLSQNTFFV